MGPGMGPGMMGMNHGSATAAEHNDIRELFFNHDRINRTVTNLPNGIRTVTESDDPDERPPLPAWMAETVDERTWGHVAGLARTGLSSGESHSVFFGA